MNNPSVPDLKQMVKILLSRLNTPASQFKMLQSLKEASDHGSSYKGEVWNMNRNLCLSL